MLTLREKFGQRLKAIRLQRKLTQEEFSELVGISVDMLSVIERGRNSPSFDKLEQIAIRLDVSVEHLFTFAPNRSK
jgi:transcriptional regulator with XRE-family HTH domain